MKYQYKEDLQKYAHILIGDYQLAEDLTIQTIEHLEEMIKERRVREDQAIEWALPTLRKSYYEYIKLMESLSGSV